MSCRRCNPRDPRTRHSRTSGRKTPQDHKRHRAACTHNPLASHVSTVQATPSSQSSVFVHVSVTSSHVSIVHVNPSSHGSEPDWQPNVRSQYSVPLQYKLSSQYESVGVCTQPVASQVSTVHATPSSQFQRVRAHVVIAHIDRARQVVVALDIPHALHTTICAVTILARITILIVR